MSLGSRSQSGERRRSAESAKSDFPGSRGVLVGPDAEILLSHPGLACSWRRVLAEFGHDRLRGDAKAQATPIPLRSRRPRTPGQPCWPRVGRNHTLADACYPWAFSALTASPEARARHDARGAKGDTSPAPPALGSGTWPTPLFLRRLPLGWRRRRPPLRRRGGRGRSAPPCGSASCTEPAREETSTAVPAYAQPAR